MGRQSSNSVRVFYPRFEQEELLARLRAGVPDLARELDLVKVILFGSRAQGRHTVASDIDLLVVYGGDAREDAYGLVKRRLGIRGLEPHVYSQAQFAEMRDTVERMTADGITIYER
jgi:predicted nucleotidyltransferase